jgi:hypothetical protein
MVRELFADRKIFFRYKPSSSLCRSWLRTTPVYFIDEAILPTIPGQIDCGADATARAAEEDRRRNHQKK